ncbi:hypothetical protein FDECE_361 [Fusarium decemcellulare]|nr:hypothetical protein FDECE_361 [Fusarium decemcellulare]
MKLSGAFLNLVAVASAIDLYAHSNGDCTGNAGVCSNMNPNVCCGGPGGGASVAARGIPIGWLVELRAYNGGDCNNLASVRGSGGGQTFLCIGGGFFTGIGYNFYGRKRDEPGNKSGCHRPDTLVLSDGSKYDLSGLEDPEFEALYPLGLDAVSPKDLPQELKSLQIK